MSTITVLKFRLKQVNQSLSTREKQLDECIQQATRGREKVEVLRAEKKEIQEAILALSKL